MAMKPPRMLGTSELYWLNLQNAYDIACARIASDQEFEEEKRVLKQLGYSYFRDHFGLPDLPRKLERQVDEVRRFLNVSSLTVLTKRDMAARFRSALADADDASIAKANAMAQIAVNEALRIDAPKFDKKQLESAVGFAVAQTRNHDGFYPLVREKLLEAGVIFVVLPNLPGSRTYGATKKIGKSILLIVNDRHSFADSFWFALFHEIGHMLKGDFGISFEKESSAEETADDEFAQNALIEPSFYQRFVERGDYSPSAIVRFADEIDRDPGIVLGRLQHDSIVRHGSAARRRLRSRYQVA